MLNTFLSSYSKMKSNNNLVMSTKLGGVEPIQEKDESERSETKTKRIDSSEDEDELGRSGEDIDLEKVEVTSKQSTQKMQKPILSPEEVQKIQ